MVAMRRDSRTVCMAATVMLLLAVAACGTPPRTASAPNGVMPLDTPARSGDQVSLAAALTQENISAGDQAVATAEIMRANAQATLRAVNSTLAAAQTQGSARQTQMAGVATTGAQAFLIQRNNDELAAGTQTAVANGIATQTQAALATSQWYTDQARQREEQRQAPMAFLWVWCLPVFLVIFAGLCLWGFWRWLRIKQIGQRNAAGPSAKLQSPADPGGPRDRANPPERDIVIDQNRLPQPDEQMRGWLDEIKGKLLDPEQDNDVNPDS